MSAFRKKITTTAIFFLLFFILSSSSALAYKITPVSGPTGPVNDTDVGGPFNFSFKFKVEKESGDSDNDQVALGFRIKIDGANALVAGSDMKKVQILYPFNQTLGNAVKMSQPISITWQDFNPKPNTAKEYNWTLSDPLDSTKVYANKTFTLKYNAPVTGGFYYITKFKHSDPKKGYFYVVSAKHNSMSSCETASAEEIKKDPTAVIATPCQEYAARPIAPPDEVIPDTETNYKLLAPLPGLESINTKPTDSNPCPFGSYFNIMFKIFLGICAVLAMIMIVWGGIQYMTSDLASSKEEGKHNMTNAIMGLILALAAYAILNTLNPDLLNICLNNIKAVSITIDEEQELEPWNQSASITGTTKTCTEGYTDVATFGTPSKINVCKAMQSNLTNMLAKAKSENILLSGWGSRTYDQQVNLRRSHSCPDVYNSPSKDCKPPTARPGYSKHESGKAVDFNCEGKNIKNTACFTWLKNNGAKYGFKNFAAEPWHWSDDGN